MNPIMVKKELPGYLADRLQEALWREALHIVNEGYATTKDLDRAMSSAKKMRAGQVFVNEWFAGGVETPFGGYGKSGYGREKGREALWNYIQTKNIAIRLGKGAAGRA